jgi:hypothetical protein
MPEKDLGDLVLWISILKRGLELGRGELAHPYALSGVHTLLGPTEPSVCRVLVG